MIIKAKDKSSHLLILLTILTQHWIFKIGHQHLHNTYLFSARLPALINMNVNYASTVKLFY